MQAALQALPKCLQGVNLKCFLRLTAAVMTSYLISVDSDFIGTGSRPRIKFGILAMSGHVEVATL